MNLERAIWATSAAAKAEFGKLLADIGKLPKKRCQTKRLDGEWCNGSTTDSDSVCLGSNPSSPASNDRLKSLVVFESPAANGLLHDAFFLL